MAAVVVTANNCRLDTAEAVCNFCSFGAGPGLGLEPNFFYQGCNSISRRAQVNTCRGHGLVLTCCCTVDLTTACGCFQTAMLKVIVITPGLLDANFCCGQKPLTALVGSSACNWYEYDLFTVSTYPAKGSWQIIAVDPNIVSHRTRTTGCPVIACSGVFGILTQVAIASNIDNTGVDAVDVGAGLTLTRGDGCGACCADGTWCSLITFDQGTVANRFGYVTTLCDIVFVLGKMVIGECANPTEFTDTCKTVVFSDGLFAAAFSGISLDVRNACSIYSFCGCTFLGRGTACCEDTRPVFQMTSDCAPGTATVANARFDAFASITLEAGITFCCVTITNTLLLTHNGGLICGATILGATTGNCVAFLVTCNPGCVKGICFTFSDGHAIEITCTGCFTFAGNVFNGYSPCNCNADSAIFNSSGGAVTLNITCCGTSAPSVRNSACSTTCIVAATAVSPVVVCLVSGDTVTMIRRCGCIIVKNQFSLSGACNTQGGTSVTVGATIGCCVPQVDNSKIRIIAANGREHRYRYDSFTGAVFTLSPLTTGTADACSSTTVLIDAAVNFVTAEVEVGDFIRNETDDVIAKVAAVCCATTLTTTPIPLTWEAKVYRINALVQTYPACSCAYAPIIERIANATTESTCLTHLGTDIDVRVSVRNAGVIFPFNQNQSITNAGLSTQTVRVADNIFN